MTDDPREPPVCFRPGALAGSLDARGENRNAIAKRDLERWYDTLATIQRQLLLTEKEASQLVSEGNGASTPSLLIWKLSQLENQYLYATTRKRPQYELWAIIDAIERFHALPADTPNKLLAVGLLR